MEHSRAITQSKMAPQAQKDLGGKLREILRHGLVYGLGSTTQALLALILIPLYTKYYTAEMYGILALIMLCSSLAGSIFFLGGSSALSRSYYDYANPDERKKAVGSALFVTLLGAGAQITLGLLLNRHLSVLLFGTPQYATLIMAAITSSAVQFISNLFYLILRFQRKSVQVIAINIGGFLSGFTLITVMLVKFRLGLAAPIFADLVNQMLICSLLMGVSRKSLGITIFKPELIAQLKYGIPVMLAGLAYYLLTYLDRFFLEHFSSLSDVGIYSLGCRIASGINVVFILPFCQIWAPMRMEYRNDANASDLYKRVLTYYLIIGVLAVGCASFFIDDFLGVVARRADYRAAATTVGPIMLGYVLYGAINIIDAGIIFSRRTMLHFYIFAVCIPFNALLNYIFIPRFGPNGAAWVCLFSFGLLIVLVFSVSQRLFKLEIEYRRLATLGIIAAASIWSGQFIRSNLMHVGGRVLILATVLFTLVFGVLSRQERSGLLGAIFRTGGRRLEIETANPV